MLVAKVGARGFQNTDHIDKGHVVDEGDFPVEEEVIIGEDALVEDVENEILKMVEIRQSMPP